MNVDVDQWRWGLIVARIEKLVQEKFPNDRRAQKKELDYLLARDPRLNQQNAQQH